MDSSLDSSEDDSIDIPQRHDLRHPFLLSRISYQSCRPQKLSGGLSYNHSFHSCHPYRPYQPAGHSGHYFATTVLVGVTASGSSPNQCEDKRGDDGDGSIDGGRRSVRVVTLHYTTLSERGRKVDAAGLTPSEEMALTGLETSVLRCSLGFLSCEVRLLFWVLDIHTL